MMRSLKTNLAKSQGTIATDIEAGRGGIYESLIGAGQVDAGHFKFGSGLSAKSRRGNGEAEDHS